MQLNLQELLHGRSGELEYWYAVDALPKSLQPLPKTGLRCKHCDRMFKTPHGYICHVVNKHSDKVIE